jgi:hypothetical protein
MMSALIMFWTGEKDIPDETGLVGTDSTLSRSLTVSTGAILSVLVPSIYTRPRRREIVKGGLNPGVGNWGDA